MRTLRLAAGSGALFALLALAFASYRTLPFDEAVSGAAYDWIAGAAGWLRFWRAVTFTGSNWVLLALAGVAAAGLAFARRYRVAVVILVATVVTALVRIGLMRLIARERPVDWLTTASGFSFPSGHATYTTVAAVLLLGLAWRSVRVGWARGVLIAVCVAWPLLVGVSRVVLTVHYPSDVLAGWLLGLTLALIALAYVPGRRVAGGEGGHGGG